MFYCDECAKKKGWPETLFKSAGVCEVCGRVKVCNNRKSSDLPRPIPKRCTLPDGKYIMSTPGVPLKLNVEKRGTTLTFLDGTGTKDDIQSPVYDAWKFTPKEETNHA